MSASYASPIAENLLRRAPRGRLEWSPEMLSALLDWFLSKIVAPPHVVVAAGHAASYALYHAAFRPGTIKRLVLIAPTWLGPLPLEPLKGLTALQSLNLRGTKVENLEPLRGLTALQWLDLSGTTVENLEPLKGLTALWFLDVSFKKVESLEPLKRLTALQELSLVGTRVENLKAIEDLPALRKLYGPPALLEQERRRFIRYREEHKLQPVEM